MKCFKPAALLQSTSGLLPQRGGLLLFPHTNKNQFTARLGLDSRFLRMTMLLLDLRHRQDAIHRLARAFS